MSTIRKENIRVTPSKRTSNTFSNSTFRGVSHLGSRIGYSKSKVQQTSSSYISTHKKSLIKEDIFKQDSVQRLNVLNDKQSNSHFSGYTYIPMANKLREKEEIAKEQKRQQMQRAKIIERVNQSKKQYFQKERLKELEIEFKRPKQATLQDSKNKQSSTVLPSKMPSIRDFSSTLTTKKAMLIGLNNMGNTCYMNSTLQCILHIPQFNDYFMSSTFKSQVKSTGKVAQAYCQLVNTMYSSTARSQTPSQLKHALGCRFHQFSGYSQQDAQQLLVSLRESLNNDLSRADKKQAKYRELTADTKKQTLSQIGDEWWNYNKQRDDSIVQDFFSGQLMSKVICTRCNNESIAFDNFQDLTLSFQKYQTSAEILKMIQLFLNEQVLSDDFFCSKCKQLRKSTKKLTIFRLPQVLVIQLKRFSYGKWRKQKINTKINFPNQLDLRSFVRQSKHKSVQNSSYQLIGVVNHSGGIDFGHYTADCKDISTGTWHTFNDSSVSDSPYNSSHRYCSSSPYLLFYYKK